MEKRIFSTNEIDKGLIFEIVKRNFSNYKLKEGSLDDMDYIIIRRSPLIACSVSYSEDHESAEKGIIITSNPIEPQSIHYLFFIIYLFTGGITLLFGYFVHKNFQANFREEVTNLMSSYLEDPQKVKYGSQTLFIMK